MTVHPQSLQRILVASDHSDQAGIAIDRAVELARQHSAEIFILHIIDEDLPPDAQSYLTTLADHHIREQLQRMPKAEALTKTIDIVVGRPDIDIVERADLVDADLIVVGLHARILEENLKIEGSVAEQIIQGTHRPVLVVKNQSAGAYGSVVVGVDFSAHCQEAVRCAAFIAPSATLHFVHALQEHALLARFRDSESRSRSLDKRNVRMRNFAVSEMEALESRALQGAENKPKVHHILVDGEASDAVIEQVSSLAADLICVGTHGRIGFSRAILGSVATDVLNSRLVDVLVVRPY